MLHGVILAGGSGTRFWPESRISKPKQFLAIGTPRPLLLETARRLHPLVPVERLLVVTLARFGSRVRNLFPALPPGRVLREPIGRNTAPAIAWAAALLVRRDADAILAVLPSDHLVRPASAFRNAIRVAAREAERGALVLFGVRPTHPATGYGYVRTGSRRSDGVREVEAFREKPDLRAARRFVRSGRYFWNSGVFVWRAARILEAIERRLPGLARAVERLVRGRFSPEAVREYYRTAPSVSIDRGVLEGSGGLTLVEAPFEWNDVGSWASLAGLQPGSADGNRALLPRGGAFAPVRSRGCFTYSSAPHLVATAGVENLVVVHTPDATLVCRADRTETVRDVVEALRRRGLGRYL